MRVFLSVDREGGNLSLFKWLCLAVAPLSALLSAALVVTLTGTETWTAGGSDIRGLAVGAALVGACIALVQWLVLGHFAAELRRLGAHIEALHGEQGALTPFRSRFGLEETAAIAQRATADTRERLKHLCDHRRELEAQARVAESERRHLEAIVNAIADAVVVTDAFNEIVLANEAAARVIGFDARSSLRRPVDQVIHDPTLVKLIRDAREGGQASRRRDVEHRLGVNGHASVYNVTLASVASTSAKPTTLDHHSPAPYAAAAGVVTILRDITREKEIAESKSDFVSNVSHELRTPLSSIKAYMEMLVDGEAQDDQTRAEFYNIIQGETNRLSRLIDNILNISRIESGVVKVQREHVVLPQLVRDAVDVMLPQARAKGIQLNLAPCTLHFQIFADRDMIYQATLNLISNAIKYTPDGGRVDVSLSVDEGKRTANVTVTDTGVGIPASDMPHLFDKFYRVADHKKLAKGTGLGLNLVKHVIETIHGGHVSATSVEGEGSAFRFALPIAENG